ncbi:DHS-like NAD/FAD-binding domain-containing protein [Phlebopus sp. FC_14]|nr:DHS-like NAD/FAD-binding domain-containing protein [Phlebopus sp. FC_14]
MVACSASTTRYHSRPLMHSPRTSPAYGNSTHYRRELDDCSFRETNYQPPICPALAGTEQIVERGAPDPVVRRADLPHCPLCGQLCRPGAVWFGEQPHRIHEILNLADTADLCIIVGTSATVQPASKLGGRVMANGGRVAVFNIEAGNHAEEADFVFLGPCEETLGPVINL